MTCTISDADVLRLMNAAYDRAKNAPREGKGTGRGPGSAGSITEDWMFYRKEATKRGLTEQETET